jgi:hypothetical protein
MRLSQAWLLYVKGHSIPLKSAQMDSLLKEPF